LNLNSPHPKQGRRVLLHICCGVCALYCIECLRKQGYAVEGFFYNPNISPVEEYLRRRNAASTVCQIMAIPFYEAEYAPQLWLTACAGYANEPEGGQRCRICYDLRLKATKDFAERKRFDYFTTTLSISPHKDSLVICERAQRLGGKRFLNIDFKKNNGFAKTMNLAKTYAVYRQRYCGCLYGKHTPKLRTSDKKAEKKY